VRVGARLLQRTTRKVGLTPTGQDLLARAPALLDELEDMLDAVSEESQGLTGILRISAPVTLGEIYIEGLLSRFTAQHPGLAIDLRLSDAYIDLASHGIDLAFRVGTPEASSLKVRKLGMLSSSLVASPDYLAKHGAPQTPQDLANHACIIDTNRRDQRWVFLDGGQEIIGSPIRRFMVNSAQIARNWAVAGCGVTLCPNFVMKQDIDAGRLIPLLKNYGKPKHPFNILYLEGNVLPRKVRALIDFAREDIKGSSLL
jgi:DNA-binding transcriptional LysR family regulator